MTPSRSSGISNASGGSVELDGETITFTPDADLCGDGAAGFDYTTSDGNGGTDTGHVSIDLACENDAPVAVDDGLGMTENDPATDVTSAILDNDTDVDHDSLTVSGVDSAFGGNVELADGTVTFTPTADLCGPDTAGFEYDISDGHGGTDHAAVSIDITCANEAPVAHNDNRSGTEDTDVVIDGGDLTSNDTDGDGDPLTVDSLENLTGGTAELVGRHRHLHARIPDLCGNDAAGFDYVVSDGQDSDTGHVTIGLECVNDAPGGGQRHRTDRPGLGGADYNVLDNDTDTEHDGLSLRTGLA